MYQLEGLRSKYVNDLPNIFNVIDNKSTGKLMQHGNKGNYGVPQESSDHFYFANLDFIWLQHQNLPLTNWTKDNSI